MTGKKAKRKRPSLSLPILRTSRAQHRAGTLTLGTLLTALGETSFGWAIVIFSLVTLLPLPPGTTLLTALPLLVTTGQMVLGYPHVRLPARLARLRIDQNRLRR
ncbi:MAG: exopolysaccharide biosynthesis protein, partial [Roseovarius sp.]